MRGGSPPSERSNFLTLSAPLRYNSLIMPAEITSGSDEELLGEEQDETPAPRRPWLLLILSPLLALLTLWAGIQWRSGLEREDRLRAELKQVYVEAETLRLQGAQAQQKVTILERQVRELAGEITGLEKQISQRSAQQNGSKGRRAVTKPAPPAR